MLLPISIKPKIKPLNSGSVNAIKDDFIADCPATLSMLIAINTMINTGTVVGVSSNLFGGGFPRKFVPSFSWGNNKRFETYQLNKAKATAMRVMERRNKELDATEAAILKHIFEETKGNRKY